MKLLSFALVVALCAAGCGDDSPAGGSSEGGANAGGESAGGQSAGGAAEGGAASGGAPASGGSSEGGATAAFCADTTAVDSCPTLTGCPAPGEALCGCAAAQEGESCPVEFTGPTEGCGFTAVCQGGSWYEEKI